MKNSVLTLAVCGALILTGCAGGFNRLPNKFDNVEYRDLVELNVLAGWSEGCARPELDRMEYLGKILSTYSAGSLNDDVAEIYKAVGDLTVELRARENPSDTYCRLKRTNIAEATDRAIQVFGRRSK